MQCQPCGRENPDDAAFCAGCGQALRWSCGACGRPSEADARFCSGCGAPVGEGPPDAPVREPRDYTPPHLAERILRSRAAIEGEHKQVTVLFADIKSSTSLAGALGAEAWHGILDGYFRILAEGVHRFEGTVNQYTGDGIMALFGAPIAHEDHAQRACWAARWLRDPLRRYSDEVRREHGQSFAVRIGIHSGEVVIGTIGDDLRMDYTAQGLTANLAQRMQELAEPGSAYLSDATARLVAGYFELADLGELKIRGLDAPVRVHRLEDAGRVLTRLALSRSRGFSRFVGRGRELEMLETALAGTLEGPGSLVSIVGEAGVGKSRLCLEFVERCRARGIPVWEAHCPSHGRAVPLRPVLELSRGFFGINEADDPAAARQKIAGALVLLDEALQRDIPLACDFLEVPDPERPLPPMDAEIRRRRVQEFLRRLVEARSARQPAVLLFDDLHWIDPESEAFLASLVPTLGATRTLLLTNLRPEYEAPWRTRPDYQQIPLAPLGRAEADALAGDLLGADPSVGELRARLVERSGGNPFFTEELVRGLADAGALQGEPGAYRAGQPVDLRVLPPTVQGILAARIDRLAEPEKRLLQTASVVGREVAEPVLRRVAELPGGELAAALDRLDRAGLLLQQSLYPVAEYAFRHPLIHEVAYGSQLGARRAATHAAVGRAIEEVEGARLDERASLLAHHWESADDAARAAGWHRRAAVWERPRSDQACLRHWQRARELLAGLEGSEANLRGRIEACTAILYQIWSTGLAEDPRDENWQRVFEEGVGLARSLGDDTAHASLLSGVAGLRGFRGEHRIEVELLQEALELIRGRGEFALEASLLQRIGWSFGLAGDNLRQIEWSMRGLDFCEQDLARSGAVSGFGTYAFLLGQTGFALINAGRLAEGEALLDRAEAVCVYTGDPFSHAGTRTARGILHFIRGNPDEQVAIARFNVEQATASERTMVQVLAFGSLTAALADAEDWAAAVEASRARPQRGVIRSYDLEFDLIAVRAHAELGETDRAGELLAGIRQDYERVPALRDDNPGALLGWARALLLLDGAAARAEIDRSIAQILELAQHKGWRSYAPFARLERAELAQLLGDEVTRERELRGAAELFREIGAPRRAAEAEAALGV